MNKEPDPSNIVRVDFANAKDKPWRCLPHLFICTDTPFPPVPDMDTEPDPAFADYVEPALDYDPVPDEPRRPPAQSKTREVNVALYSPFFIDLVKDDFAVWIARLYIRTRDPLRLQRARELIGQVHDAAERLDDMSHECLLPSDAAGEPMKVRLILPEAEPLVEAIAMADYAMAAFSQAGLSHEVIDERLAGFQTALGALVRFSYGDKRRPAGPVRSALRAKRERVTVRQSRFQRAKAFFARRTASGND